MFEDIGGNLIDGLKKGLTDAITGIKEWLKTNVVDKILDGVEKVKEITATIKGKVDSTFDTVKEKWDSVKDKTAELLTEAKETVGSTIDNLKSKWDNWKAGVKSLFTKTEEEKGHEISVVKNAWDAFVANPGVAKLVASAPTYDQISKAVTDLKKKVKDNLKTKIETKLKEPKPKNKKKVKNAIKNWKKGINTTITMSLDVTSNVGSLQNWINNNIIKPINDSMAAVSKKAGTKYTAIKGLAQGGFANTATPVVFGEAGAEAIIPLERNLGAINKIAKVMLKGMADVSKYQSMATPSSLG